jgi:hypothetical protein
LRLSALERPKLCRCCWGAARPKYPPPWQLCTARQEPWTCDGLMGAAPQMPINGSRQRVHCISQALLHWHTQAFQMYIWLPAWPAMLRARMTFVNKGRCPSVGASDSKSFYLQRCWSLVCVLLRMAGCPCYLRWRRFVRLMLQEGTGVHGKPACQRSVNAAVCS